MKVVFRADSSSFIGAGHVMRCLSLADTLKKHGISSIFISRALNGSIMDVIDNRGHQLVSLAEPVINYTNTGKEQDYGLMGVSWQQDAQETIAAINGEVDILFTDHYAIDNLWHRELKNYVNKIVVIDDLADRKYECDFLIDQTYGREAIDYIDLIPSGCKLLLGSEYAMLRSGFSNLRKEVLEKRKNTREISKLLITMGGTDPKNYSLLVLKAINNSKRARHLDITLVQPAHSPFASEIQQYIQTSGLRVTILSKVDNMDKLMAETDFSVGSSGSTTWERCTLALPAMVVVSANNQARIAHTLEQIGAIRIWDSQEKLTCLLDEVFEDINIWVDMMIAASALCDGNGCDRIVKKLMKNDCT